MTDTESKIAAAIAERSRDGRLPCAVAEEFANQLAVPMKAVGKALDNAGIKITLCQLGLFGVPPKKTTDTPPDPPVLAALRRLPPEASLSCTEAWEIAKDLSVPRRDVGAACEAEGIKITRCQLGAF